MKAKAIAVLMIAFLFIAKSGHAATTEEALKQTMDAFDTAKTYNKMVPLVGKFKLIAIQNPDNWLSNYYAAWSLTILCFQEPDKDKKAPLLDEADSYFDKIKNRDSSDEINVLGAMLAQARISVKPSSYKKYGDIATKYLDKAKAINPNNPRIYALEGNSKYYTPKMFGGGPKKALPYFEKAVELYAKQTDKDITKPYWGGGQANEMLKKCQGEGGDK